MKILIFLSHTHHLIGTSTFQSMEVKDMSGCWSCTGVPNQLCRCSIGVAEDYLMRWRWESIGEYLECVVKAIGNFRDLLRASGREALA